GGLRRLHGPLGLGTLHAHLVPARQHGRRDHEDDLPAPLQHQVHHGAEDAVLKHQHLRSGSAREAITAMRDVALLEDTPGGRVHLRGLRPLLRDRARRHVERALHDARGHRGVRRRTPAACSNGRSELIDMPRRDTTPQDDVKRSYGALWLVLSLLLFVGALWAVADDNIFRRPWKKWQAGFNRLEISRMEDAIGAEN